MIPLGGGSLPGAIIPTDSPNTGYACLLVAQGHHWIDTCGAACRNVTGHKCDR